MAIITVRLFIQNNHINITPCFLIVYAKEEPRMKKHSTNKKSNNWKSIFLIIVCIISLCLSVASFIIMLHNHSNMDTISQKLDNYSELLQKDEENYKSDAYVEFCESVNSRMDNAVSELITIVGVFASIMTLLGVLITFKAPKDIEKEIVELKGLFEKTNDIIEEQEYLLLISDAVKEKTTYHRIRSLTQIITKSPNRWQAYLYRGSEYDNKKEYDKAIKDYKMSNEYGCDDEVYYNNVSIALSKRYKVTKNKIDQEQAIQYISKAIEINPEDANYFNNRGSIYGEMEKHELAKKDFETAISIDPENYEAYANLAKWTFAMMRINNNQEEQEKYRNNAITFIEKALELNYEDSQNLKQLSDLLSHEHESDKRIKSIIDTLIKVNERSGDIDYQEEDYISAISGYAKALSVFNGAPIEIIQDNIDIIKRICEKIYDTKNKTSGIDANYSLERKLILLIYSIIQIAFECYKEQNYSEAGILFEYATVLNGFGTVSSNNLAYMIRRGEYDSKKFNIPDLLNCKSLEDSSSFLRINRALCHLTGKGLEKDFKKALVEINICNDELEEAIKWWENKELVGEEESNVVLFLLLIMDKIKYEDETGNINDITNDMLETAKQDGYDIPANYIDEVNCVKTGQYNG